MRFSASSSSSSSSSIVQHLNMQVRVILWTALNHACPSMSHCFVHALFPDSPADPADPDATDSPDSPVQIVVTDTTQLEASHNTNQDATPNSPSFAGESPGLSEDELRILAMLERELLMQNSSEDNDVGQENDSLKEAPESGTNMKGENSSAEAWPEVPANLVERGDDLSSDAPEASIKAERGARFSSKVPEVAKRQTSRSPARSGIPTFQRSSSGSGRQSSPARSRLPLASPESRPVNGVNICNRNGGGDSMLRGVDPEKKEGDLAWEVNISDITGRARRTKKRTCECVTLVGRCSSK